MAGPRILPFGDAAVLVELDAVASVEAARRARAVAEAIAARGVGEPALGVPVPAATSVLVPFDPLALDPRRVTDLVDEVLARGAAAPPEPASATVHRIPVRYGGGDGPDLASVAAELDVTPAELVDLHTGEDFEVLFLGFAPGFAYLGDLPRRLVVPRLATPRVRVPAGSVAIAGTMSAIYPHASPGGWRVLGRTEVSLWDPSANPPARLRPGDKVRFEPA